MSTATQRLITAEEFFGMPEPADGSLQELVRGIIITMPPPGTRHGVCCLKVGRRIGNFVDEKGLGTVACNDSGFVSERNPDSVRGPDVSFWTRERLPEVPEGYTDVAPDLVVEVVSPSDHYSRLRGKLREYFRAGVRRVWVVDPEDRSVSVYRSVDDVSILMETKVLSGEDVLPGFSCPVADLFA